MRLKIPFPASARGVANRLVLASLLALTLPAPGWAYTQDRVATDEAGNPIRIHGSVVLIEPDIELSEVLAGGVQEPRKEWTETARRLYPEAVHARLTAANTPQRPDYLIPKDLAPESKLGQIIRLNEAVSISVLNY